MMRDRRYKESNTNDYVNVLISKVSDNCVCYKKQGGKYKNNIWFRLHIIYFIIILTYVFHPQDCLVSQ